MKKSNLVFAIRWILSLIFVLNSISVWALGPMCSSIFTSTVASEKQITDSELQTRYQSLANSKYWHQSELLYWQHLKVIREFSEKIEKYENLPSADLENQNFNSLLKKFIFNPRAKLTSSEINLLKTNKFHKEIFEGTLTLLAVGELSGKALQRVLLYWTGRSSHLSLPYENGVIKKALRSIQAAYNGPVRFFVPFLPLPRWNNPVDRILEKKYLDPNYIPNNVELETLKKYKALETFEKNSEFQRARPNWSLFRRWVSRLLVAGIAINGAFVANWGLHLAKPDALISVQAFLAEPQNRLSENQVRIYNESVPFPHMAIEIDGKVYSYGQTHLSIKTSQEYLLSDSINDIARKQTAEGRKTQVKIQDQGSSESLDLYHLVDKTGLSKLPRSVQMVTLNLDIQQKSQLKKYLERSEYSAYRNQTLIMDCASMITLALKKNTQVPLPTIANTPLTLDASPSGMMMYFGWLKTLDITNQNGQPLIADVRQVAMEQAENKNLHLYRNLYINALEGRVLLSFLPINAIARTYMNVRYGENQFQFLEPEIRNEVLAWQGEVKKELLNPDPANPLGNQIAIFLEEATLLGQVPQQKRDQQWQQNADQITTASSYFLDREIADSRDKMNSPDSAFADALRAGYRHSLLLDLKQNLSTTLNNGHKRQDLFPSRSAEQVLNHVRTH